MLSGWRSFRFSGFQSGGYKTESLDNFIGTPIELSEARWQRAKPVLGELFSKAEFVMAYFSWRPGSPDPADEHVIDCAMNAGAVVITSNVSDFKLAEESLGLRVLKPVDFVNQLAEELGSE